MSADPRHAPPAEPKLILTGLGGQGVIFATRLLAHAAIGMGLEVIASETHGMSQRGGSVLSHLRIGGTEAPLIRRGTADILYALDAEEAVRSLPFLRPGGLVFANAAHGLMPEVGPTLDMLGIEVHCLDATSIAKELGAAPVANVVLAGFAAAHPAFPIPMDALRRSVETVAPKAGKLNLDALLAGSAAAQTDPAAFRSSEGPLADLR